MGYSKRCSYPVAKPDAIKPCGRQTVVVFRRDGIEYPRCKGHSSASVFAAAEQAGFEPVAA